MQDEELYGDFSKEEMDAYAKEAKERWGRTDAYKQSAERVKKMTKDDFARIKKEGDDLMKAIIACRGEGPASAAMQALIARHYDALRSWYEPDLQMYRGLGDMYVNDRPLRGVLRKIRARPRDVHARRHTRVLRHARKEGLTGNAAPSRAAFFIGSSIPRAT